MAEGATGRCCRGVKYVSPCGYSGYGTAARRILLGLRNAGVPFTWTPMVAGRGWDLYYEPFTGRGVGDVELDPFCNKPIEYDTVIVNHVPEYFLRWCGLESGKRMIGYTVWETDRLPHHWPFLLEQMDRVLVPCTFNKSVFEKRRLSVPVDVVPHIADAVDPPPGDPPVKIRPDDFVFYCIETWTARKAPWNLIRTFLDTFTSADAVTLVLKTSKWDHYTRRRPWLGPRSVREIVAKLLRRYPNPARICLVTRELSGDEMLRFLGRSDCYVSLSHGEGWNIGAFDSAAMGKPVILPAFGGPLDYLPDEMAYLTKYRLAPVRDDLGKPSFTEDQNWAEPDLGHASSLMRHVFEHREEAAARGQQLRRLVREKFSEGEVIGKLLEIIDH